jgi:hypothetical protein
MREYLETQIGKRRQRLAAIDTERNQLSAELTALEAALEHSQDPANEADLNDANRPKSRLSKRPSFNLSPTWVAILERLSGFQHFNARDVRQIAATLHREQTAIKEQTYGNVRVQFSLYTKRGILKRLGGGNYKVSEMAKIALRACKTITSTPSLVVTAHSKNLRPTSSVQKSAGDAR